MTDGDDSRPRAEQPLELLHHDLSTVVDRRDTERGSLLFTEQLPGDDVRMVLHAGDEHLVTGPHVASAVARGDEVDRLGRPSGEDDLFCRGGAQELANRLARLLVGLGRPDRQVVDAPVDVGVVLLVHASLGVDDHLWLLARRRVVQEGERLAVHGALEDGELASHFIDVERPAGDRARSAHHSSATGAPGSRALRTSRTTLETSGTPTRATSARSRSRRSACSGRLPRRCHASASRRVRSCRAGRSSPHAGT